MRITDVRTALLQGNFEWLLINVETDAGITGLGEAHWGAGVRDAIRFLRRFLIGEDARDIDRLWRRMYRVTSGAPLSGSVVCAANGIEMALYDAVGKLYGMPVWQLLGGRYRDRVEIYADCHAGQEAEPDATVGTHDAASSSADWHEQYAPAADYRAAAYVSRARDVVARGFSSIKFDLDVPTPLQADPHNRTISRSHLDYMVELAAGVREAVGPDVRLAFDCHCAYNVSDAIRLARALEPYGLWWLEDPVAPERVEAVAQVTAATATPICTGENLYLREPFARLLAMNGADVIEPDLPRSGGLAELRRICDLADFHGVTVAPHNVCSPVSTIAAVHLGAAVPNFLAVEFHAIDVPWWSRLVVGSVAEIRDGHLTVPDGPGLGVTVDEEVARAHLVPGTGYFDDGVN